MLLGVRILKKCNLTPPLQLGTKEYPPIAFNSSVSESEFSALLVPSINSAFLDSSLLS